jgi:hypothetical protein
VLADTAEDTGRADFNAEYLIINLSAEFRQFQ